MQRTRISLIVLVVGLSISAPALRGDDDPAPAPDVPEKSKAAGPSAEEIARRVKALEKAGDTTPRDDIVIARAVRRVFELGADALDAARKARDSAGEKPCHEPLQRVVRALHAAKLTKIIEARVATNLFFDGQYDDLRSEGAEGVAALIFIVDDEDAHPAIRRGAINALADLATPESLTDLRRLERDPLLPELLREELGMLMAILGDTRNVQKTIREISRRIEHENPLIAVPANTELAHVYYRIRSYKKATECYERVLAIFDDLGKRPGFRPTAEFFREKALHHYNAACSYSLAGEIEKARENLEKAARIDRSHLENMEKDGDLKRAREAEGWAEFKKKLVESTRRRSI